MLSELQDYGLIFILLAVFGFIILDIFKTGQYWGIPDFYKSNIEKFFHYISTAILFLSFSLVFLVLTISSPNQENAITKFAKSFLTIFDKFHELGILTNDSYALVVRVVVFSSFFLPFFISFYILLYF